MDASAVILCTLYYPKIPSNCWNEAYHNCVFVAFVQLLYCHLLCCLCIHGYFQVYLKSRDLEISIGSLAIRSYITWKGVQLVKACLLVW